MQGQNGNAGDGWRRSGVLNVNAGFINYHYLIRGVAATPRLAWAAQPTLSKLNLM